MGRGYKIKMSDFILLGVVDSKPSFSKHTNNKISKAIKSIRLLCKLEPIVSRRRLLISLLKMQDSHYQWKMLFNPDQAKQVQ